MSKMFFKIIVLTLGINNCYCIKQNQAFQNAYNQLLDQILTSERFYTSDVNRLDFYDDKQYRFTDDASEKIIKNYGDLHKYLALIKEHNKICQLNPIPRLNWNDKQMKKKRGDELLYFWPCDDKTKEFDKTFKDTFNSIVGYEQIYLYFNKYNNSTILPFKTKNKSYTESDTTEFFNSFKLFALWMATSPYYLNKIDTHPDYFRYVLHLPYIIGKLFNELWYDFDKYCEDINDFTKSPKGYEVIMGSKLVTVKDCFTYVSELSVITDFMYQITCVLWDNFVITPKGKDNITLSAWNKKYIKDKELQRKLDVTIFRLYVVCIKIYNFISSVSQLVNDVLKNSMNLAKKKSYKQLRDSCKQISPQTLKELWNAINNSDLKNKACEVFLNYNA